MTTASERLQGTVDVLVLKTLAWKPMHGYAIAQFLADRSRGELAVEGAALYQGLHRLERKGLIRSRWGTSETRRRVRIYQLTPEGRAQLAAEADGWKRYAAAVARVLAVKDADA
jgi:PadR family transcriptional regulator PadR